MRFDVALAGPLSVSWCWQLPEGGDAEALVLSPDRLIAGLRNGPLLQFLSARFDDLASLNRAAAFLGLLVSPTGADRPCWRLDESKRPALLLHRVESSGTLRLAASHSHGR